MVSFANDIAPTLSKYRGEMAWRFDLAKYDDVKANAEIIAGQTHVRSAANAAAAVPAVSKILRRRLHRLDEGRLSAVIDRGIRSSKPRE